MIEAPAGAMIEWNMEKGRVAALFLLAGVNRSSFYRDRQSRSFPQWE
jgi:hypothetical protein